MRQRTSGRLLAIAAVVMALAGCTGQNGEPEPGADATDESAASSATSTADTEVGVATGGSGRASMAVATDIVAPVPGSTTAASGVTVTGAGIASGAPDVAHVTVGVEAQRPTVDEALDAANSATEEVLAVLDDLGIAEEDRQTRNVSIHPVMEPRSEGQPEITGYQVRNMIEVTVREVDRLGEVIQRAAEAAGDLARVEGISFGLENDDELVAAAREAAMADARAQAEHYAEIVGMELGALIGIQDQSTSSPRPARSFAAEEAAADSGVVPIAPGEQDVVVHVIARWAFQ